MRNQPYPRQGVVNASLTLCLLLPMMQVQAATFRVNSTTDAVDANPGDGRCRTSTGTCTLRAAIQEANATSSADTIEIPAGLYTITRAPQNQNNITTGDLDITRPLTITGDGAGVTIIDGGEIPVGSPPERTALDRLFEIHATAGNVTISGLTLREGWDAKEGGALYNVSRGTVRLVEVNVLDSVAVAKGGAIYYNGAEGGSLILERSTIEGNITGGEGGGIYMASGSLRVIGTATVNSRISDNAARNGGGIYSAGVLTVAGSRSRVELVHTTLSGNSANGVGGAIANDLQGDLILTDVAVEKNSAAGDGAGVSSRSKTSLAVTRGTFSGNAAGGAGGGVSTHTEGAVTIDASAFTGNRSGQGPEDAIDVEGGGGGLSVDGSGPVTVSFSTFSANTADDEGGGIAIHSSGPVTITDSVVTNNVAGLGGGGIFNSGMIVTFIRLAAAGNSTTGDGGGIANLSSGEFTILDSSVSLNIAQNGGGFANIADAIMRISGTTVGDNHAQVAGGGFLHLSDGASVIENSTISGNSAGQFGGGLMANADADLDIVNVTVSGNDAAQIGGGLMLDPDAGVHIVNATITRNAAPYGAGVGTPDGISNFPVVPNPLVVFRNTIVAGNLGAADCFGAFTSEGGNMDGGTLCYFNGTGDRSNVRPTMGDLADNGGPTLTHALTPASLAVDAGVSISPPTDQRGIPRPQNGACDSGAYEFEGVPLPRDNAPPDTEITQAPGSSTGTAVFQFAGTDNAPGPFTFECRLLNADPAQIPDPAGDPRVPPDPAWAFRPCASPWTTEVQPGQDWFQVRAVDRAGNVDPTPATHSWADSAPPEPLPPISVAANADAWIEQTGPSNNKGTDSILKLQSKGPSQNFRAVVGFALPSKPTGYVVQSATLHLFASAAATGRSLHALEITDAWTENNVTWENQPATTGTAAATGSGLGYLEWNVTSQVKEMYSKHSHNGFLIRDAAEGGGAFEQQFHSREKGQDPPTLVITFAPAGQ